MTWTIKTVKAAEVVPIRVAAFTGLGVSGNGTTPQDELPDTLHSAVVVDGQVLSVGTLSRDPSPRNDFAPVWRIQGMATLPGHEGHGYGGSILRAYMEHIVDNGGGMLWGHLRIAAVPFYERHGFVVDDEVYVTSSGAAHQYGELHIPLA